MNRRGPDADHVDASESQDGTAGIKDPSSPRMGYASAQYGQKHTPSSSYCLCGCHGEESITSVFDYVIIGLSGNVLASPSCLLLDMWCSWKLLRPKLHCIDPLQVIVHGIARDISLEPACTHYVRPVNMHDGKTNRTNKKR